MKHKVVEDADSVTYVVVCDPGDEAFASLTDFARREQLESSQLTAVGAFEHAVVGWFDRDAKQYRHILHAHVVLGLRDGTTRGGHLLEGHVYPTLEVVVRETPAELRRVVDKDVGIALIDLDAST